MQLSSEDLLRLNVLLAHELQAVRVDEQTLTVYALTADDEARIPLNPNCRPEQYLRRVRETLSNHALGSPGGYPVFLQRWTRMGQARDAQLEKLLLLGESEAVVAVAGAPGLTDEIARRAWWAMPTADVARRMLEREAVVQGNMGKVLAEYLVEHLPFETESLSVITTVRLVLQPGLIDDATRTRIWARSTSRNTYRLGFLAAVPDDLPAPLPARPGSDEARAVLASLTARNTFAALLAKLLDSAGQTFLAVSAEQMQHPLDKDTVAVLLDVVGNYFEPARCGEIETDFAGALARAETTTSAGGSEIGELLSAVPELKREVVAMLALAHCSEALATPVLARTSATGSLLRRKLEPTIAPLLAQIAVLQGRG
ncbi:MAG: sulfur reduction protein DsrS [Gammaproteobacteria bacterium]|nr:MAG: sulfur reduction protein DsrS [Gammaproteobacteria bacterium]